MTAVTASDRLSTSASQAVFRVLLASLSRPGRVMMLPASCASADGGAGTNQLGPGIVPLALAVIDSKVAVIGSPAWQARICHATGASPADVTEASLVAIYGAADAATVSSLRRGSAAEPESGAKVGLACGGLNVGTGEVTLELAGPGVPGRIRLGVDGVGAAVFETLSAVNEDFPAGVDVWLVDGHGQVTGLPRSTRLAVI
jgi:alpha-D-ribose 1-methylphosphonate 5-triphosphate synthase subunit PhnH